MRIVHLVPHVQGQACSRARLSDDALERRRSSTGQENVRFIGEILPGNSVVSREAMPLRERHEQLLRQQGLRHQHLTVDRWSKDPDIDPAVLEGQYLLRRRQAVQFDLDLRVALPEPADDLGPAREVGPRRAADEQLTDFPLARAPRDPHGSVGLGDDDLGLVEEHPTSARELYAPARPPEQGHLKLLLQPSDLLAQGRLRDVKARGRPAKVQLFSDGDEVPEMSKLHRVPIS